MAAGRVLEESYLLIFREETARRGPAQVSWGRDLPMSASGLGGIPSPPSASAWDKDSCRWTGSFRAKHKLRSHLVGQVAILAQGASKEGNAIQLPGAGHTGSSESSQAQGLQMSCSQWRRPCLRKGPLPEPMAWRRADRAHRASAEP